MNYGIEVFKIFQHTYRSLYLCGYSLRLTITTFLKNILNPVKLWLFFLLNGSVFASNHFRGRTCMNAVSAIRVSIDSPLDGLDYRCSFLRAAI